jgi:hypothetical protein
MTPVDPGAIYNMACEDATTLASSDPANAARHLDHAMRWLRLAAEAGWNDTEHMRTDPDMDRLRSRPDYQLLILDIAFPPDPFATAGRARGGVAVPGSRPNASQNGR